MGLAATTSGLPIPAVASSPTPQFFLLGVLFIPVMSSNLVPERERAHRFRQGHIRVDSGTESGGSQVFDDEHIRIVSDVLEGAGHAFGDQVRIIQGEGERRLGTAEDNAVRPDGRRARCRNVAEYRESLRLTRFKSLLISMYSGIRRGILGDERARPQFSRDV